MYRFKKLVFLGLISFSFFAHGEIWWPSYQKFQNWALDNVSPLHIAAKLCSPSIFGSLSFETEQDVMAFCRKVEIVCDRANCDKREVRRIIALYAKDRMFYFSELLANPKKISGQKMRSVFYYLGSFVALPLAVYLSWNMLYEKERQNEHETEKLQSAHWAKKQDRLFNDVCAASNLIVGALCTFDWFIRAKGAWRDACNPEQYYRMYAFLYRMLENESSLS